MSKKGFTLAETLIVLAILGVIAAIAIPSLISKHKESADRTKVKKAMAAYEKALNNMIMENNLKSNDDIIAFGEETVNDVPCGKTRPYFKSIEDGKVGETPSNCRFKTADRVWWDITNIENPIIMLDDAEKAKTLSELQDLADDELSTNKTVFGMVGRYGDSGILRVNDKGYEDSKGSDTQKAEVAKLYDFINNSKTASGGTSGGDDDEICPNVAVGGTCEIDGVNYTKVEFTQGCTTMYDDQELCLDTAGPTVTKYNEVFEYDYEYDNATNWENAKNSCGDGHLATAVEIQQMWNTVVDNGNGTRLLETLCGGCSSENGDVWFWTSDESTDGPYIFTLDDGGNFSYSEDGHYDTNGRIVCVGN